MKAFGWAADEGGCAYYRLQAPFRALAELGHTTGHAIRYTADWDDADVIIGARVCNPGPSQRWQEWAGRGRRLVYDVDDDYFHVDPDSPAWSQYARQDVQRRIVQNAAAADAVTVCSPRLLEVMRAYNPRTVYVPNGLPAEILSWGRPDRGGPLVLGWAGTPATAADLATVARRLCRFLDRHPDVEMHTVGLSADEVAGAGLRHERVRVTPWVAGTEAYLQTIAESFDVWVAPYRASMFNRAKAPTKGLEAAFLGIPIVASDIEPYARFVKQRETGLLVRQDHEWDHALHALVTDSKARVRFGRAAKELAAAEHTVESIAPQWERVLSGSSG